MKETISPVFWTNEGWYAFQKVGVYWNLYIEGDFVDEFRSFAKMCEVIEADRKKKGIEL